MIISKSPLRISLFGGGTDIKKYYTKYGTSFVSLAIDKYVYSIVHKPFEEMYFLKYRDNEVVDNLTQIKNTLLRNTLLTLNLKNPIEISNFADIPFGTGLGSSGAYIASIVCALESTSELNLVKNKYSLAKKASYIETNNFDSEVVGLQDTYVSVFGGLKLYKINKVGKIKVEEFMSKSDIINFTDNISIYFTNVKRKSIDQKSLLSKKEIEVNLKTVSEIASEGEKALLNNDLKLVGKLLYEQWLLKLSRNPTKFHKNVNKIILDAIDLGAYGGKLIGAGGGGFILIFSNKRRRNLIDSYMKKSGFRKVDFNVDFNGTKRIII